MFAARNTMRIARLAPRQTTTLVARAMPATPATPAGHRGLTISYPVFKANPVNENQVRAMIYTPEGKLHAAIPVLPEDKVGPTIPATNEMENLTTLSDESYQMLPATVKSMTVKGKIIIVTG